MFCGNFQNHFSEDDRYGEPILLFVRGIVPTEEKENDKKTQYNATIGTRATAARYPKSNQIFIFTANTAAAALEICVGGCVYVGNVYLIFIAATEGCWTFFHVLFSFSEREINTELGKKFMQFLFLFF